MRIDSVVMEIDQRVPVFMEIHTYAPMSSRGLQITATEDMIRFVFILVRYWLLIQQSLLWNKMHSRIRCDVVSCFHAYTLYTLYA